MAKEVPQLVKASLRAVLLSSQKGIKQTAIEKDYHKLTNSKLDVKKYGFRDLYEFLLAVPDVARLEYSAKDAENKVFGVAEKGVYMSEHAKKAAGIPSGLKALPPSEWPRNKTSKDSKERTVVEIKTSLKVTVESDSKRKIMPNSKGLYTLHVKNLPPGCNQGDINRIFKKYQSLKEVKIESSSSNRAAFVRFSNFTDADKALSEMDGHNLQGFSLIVNPGIERTAKVRKDVKEEPKVDRTKKKDSTVFTNHAVDNKELSPGNSMKTASPSPKYEMQTVVPAENWETDDGLLPPKMATDKNNKFFGQEKLAACVHVNKMERCHSIHVSNFPPGTGQSKLKQVFSECGEVVYIDMHEKFAFVYFSKKEDALTALQTVQKKVKLGERILTVTPRLPKGKPKQQDNLPVGACALSYGSSQSSISSIEPITPPSPGSFSNPDTAVFGFTDSSHEHTPTGRPTGISGSVNVNAEYRKPGKNCVVENQGNNSSVTNTTNNRLSQQPERKMDGQKLNMCTSLNTVTAKSVGNASSTIEPHVSGNLKQRSPVHTLLTCQEMRELAKRCDKPMRTANCIAFEEFLILVTDVVDSCHFWAHIDDKIGSYKKLEEIGADLQNVEHHKRCMPVKYQLGAALYSEDKKWYRCWCLEVSTLEQKEAKVFFVDYGNCEWISWEQFTDIHKRFWDLAPQAVPFKLSGLENAPNVPSDILNEGSRYLSELICNKVCRARKTKHPDSSKPHIIEVELILSDGKNTSVNDQMALTSYVQKTRTVAQETIKNLSLQESNLAPSQQTPITQPWQAEKHIPPHPFMKTQAAQATHSAAQPLHHSLSQEPLPSKQPEPSQQLFEISQAHSTQRPLESPQGRQGGLHQQASQNANLESTTKSPQGTIQHQPSLPNQLFEKREVIEVFLSSVSSSGELLISLFLADEKTKETLKKIHHQLKDSIDPKATGCKIYPRKGDVVAKVFGNTMFRVKIISIPSNTNSAYGIDKVRVQCIDYGMMETVPLSALCELPHRLKDIPPQVKQARLAGIRKKQGMLHYPDAAMNYLIQAKKKREVLQASVIKREQDGFLHVELFGSSAPFPSLNVQLVKMGYADIDPSQCPQSGSDGGKSAGAQTSSNMPHTATQSPGWHRPGLPERTLDEHQSDTHSELSDWEDSLLQIEEDWNEVTPVASSHTAVNGRQSREELYAPPSPDIHLSSVVGPTHSPSHPSTAGSVSSVPLDKRTSSSPGQASRSYPDILPISSSSAHPDMEHPYSVRPPLSSANLNMHQRSTGEPESRVPNDVRPPSPSTTGSDSSGVYSDTSINSLSSAESTLNSREEKSLQDRGVLQHPVESNTLEEDWWQERAELIQKDDELKRILEMPRQELRKMISLRQEKEKLERKIRIKGLENQILKLRKELKQLEAEKEELGGEINE